MKRINHPIGMALQDQGKKAYGGKKASRLSRRGLLKTVTAASVLAATGVYGSGYSAPKKGGRLKAGLSGAHTSDSWDGRTHADLFMAASASGAVFDTLTAVAADGSLVGELAESWDAGADAGIWTFNLRKGVRFHNGKAFGADDVIESLRLHIADGTSSPARPIISAITEMRKITDHQVQFTLAGANADFPYLMSDYHLLMYPAGQIDAAIAKGIGTGLYEVVSLIPGVRFVGKRVASHYKDGTAGWFDEIEFIAINDNGARMNALLTGRVDAVNRIDFKSEKTLRAADHVRIQEVTGNQYYSFPMLSGIPPYNDLNVRRALKYGIDRQDMVDRVLMGHGVVGNDTPIGPASQFYVGDLEQLSYDPDRAKYHLGKAGMTSLDVDLSTSDAAFDDGAQLFQASARMAGINVNLKSESADGYWSRVWMKEPFCACYWSGRATEDWMFSSAYQAGAPWNDSQWDHRRFQDLLQSARAELDTQKRGAHYREMQDILRTDGAVLIPMFANYVQGVTTTLGTPETIGNLWQMDNARMSERWWVA